MISAQQQVLGNLKIDTGNRHHYVQTEGFPHSPHTGATNANQVTYIAPQIREKISIQGRFTSVILP
jgi:hypothetical protein